MSSEWTEELKAQVIKDYTSKNPTAENSTEITKEIADAIGKTVNGVRMILVKAEVYVKAGEPKSTKKESTGTPKVGKAEALAALNEVITNNGLELDEEITSKLTGKAAKYFCDLLTEVLSKEV